MRTIRMQVGYWDPDYDGRVAIRDAHHHELCDFKLNKDCNFYNNSRFPEPGERCMMVKIRDYVEWISLSWVINSQKADAKNKIFTRGFLWIRGFFLGQML